MKLLWHKEIDTFLALTQESLESQEALNNLMLGISLRIKEEPHYYQDVLLATVTDRGGLVLAALMTPPQKLVVYGQGEGLGRAVQILSQSLAAQGFTLPGVVGPQELVSLVCKFWPRLVPCQVQLEMQMRVYKLNRVNLKVLGAGTFRRAQEEDLDFLTEAIYGFNREVGLQPGLSWEKCRQAARERLGEGSLYLWEDQGSPVSVAATARATRNGASVNLVYTPPELRGRGYATSTVAALSQHLLNSGCKFCSLFADLANPVSNSIYQRIGYRPVGDFAAYLFRDGEEAS